MNCIKIWRHNKGVSISKFLLWLQLPPRVGHQMAEIKTSLYYDLSTAAKRTAAAVGVKVEQSFNFGLAAMQPQFCQKWQRQQSFLCFYVSFATA